MLPFGYWFNPSDEQLSQILEEIDHRRLTPYRLSTDGCIEYVKDTDHTNGFQPRNLNWDPKEGLYDNLRYCCIRRQKFSEKAKKKTSRKSGSGNLSWKNTGNCDDLFGGKAQKLKLTLAEKGITWIMHEYTLKDNSTTDFQEWAICRIERKINNNKDKEKRTTSRTNKKGKGKAAGTKEGTKESGSNFNMQGQDCDEQKVDNDPTIEMKNSSYVEPLQENLRESGTSNKATEESGRRDIKRLQDCLEQPIQDDPRFNIEDHPYYKDLEQILRVQKCHNLDDDPPMNILDDNESFNELLSSLMQDPQAV